MEGALPSSLLLLLLLLLLRGRMRMTKGGRGRGGVAVVVVMEDCNDDDDGGSMMSGELWYNDKMNDEDTQYKHSRIRHTKASLMQQKQFIICARNPETKAHWRVSRIIYHMSLGMVYGRYMSLQLPTSLAFSEVWYSPLFEVPVQKIMASHQ